MRSPWEVTAGNSIAWANSLPGGSRTSRDQDGEEDLDAPSPRLGMAYEEMLMQLNEPTLRQVAHLRLASHTNDEIAEKLGCSLATVNRRVAEIRHQWSRFQ